MQLTLSKLGFRGTWLPWRNVRSRLYDGAWERWRIMSCGSFRGGHWYLPIRNHDNRYFADWIRLCPGLSKNSENGNSCPKPHKAARMIEAVGRAVSIETETIIAIWILPRRSSRLYKGKLIKMETKIVKWTESSLQKLECLLAPKTKQSYLFLAPLQWPWQGCCWNLPRECNAVRRSCVPPPPYRHYRHCPPPTIRFDPLAWSSGSDQRRISGCGIRWLLAGPDSLPLWLCRVCAFVLLRCFSCSHTVLPKEHSLGVTFFSSLSSCKCCIFLQFYLHFTTDYTCMIVYVTNNKEPWTGQGLQRDMTAGNNCNIYCNNP